MRQWFSTWKKRLLRLKQLLWKSQSSEAYPLVKEVLSTAEIKERVQACFERFNIVEPLDGLEIENPILQPPTPPNGKGYAWLRYQYPNGEADWLYLEHARKSNMTAVPVSRHPDYEKFALNSHQRDSEIVFEGKVLMEFKYFEQRKVAKTPVSDFLDEIQRTHSITEIFDWSSDGGLCLDLERELELRDSSEITPDHLDKMYQNNWYGVRPLRPKDLEIAKEKGFKGAHIKHGLVWSDEKVVCEIRGTA